MSEELDKFKAILAEVEDIYLRIPVQELKLEHKIIDDLGIDSLGRVAIFHELCFEFDFEADEAIGIDWITIQDILSFIKVHTK
jgi:acyl carrier protein